MKSLLPLTLLAALSISGSAAARPSVNDLARAYSVRAAEAAWPANRCDGRERVSWDQQLGEYAGVALSGCRVKIAPHPDFMWAWPYTCAVVIHEYGHLAGHDHSDDPTSIMYSGTLPIPHVCMALPKWVARRAARG